MDIEIETHEDVCAEMRSFGNVPPPMFAWRDLAERAEAAHKRELDGLIANLDALEKAVEEMCDGETVKKIIAKKNEIQNG